MPTQPMPLMVINLWTVSHGGNDTHKKLMQDAKATYDGLRKANALHNYKRYPDRLDKDFIF